MADVFLSYSKAERRLTEELALDLVSAGLTVWWDTNILPGEEFKDVILEQLGNAKAAIVIWTRASVKSDWVYSEAKRARHLRKLIPVKEAELDIYQIPPPFDAIHTDLLDNRPAIFAALEKLGLKTRKNFEENISPLDEQEQEAVRWLEIRQSASENEFRHFLTRFPNGSFKSKAKSKIDNLTWTKTLVEPTVQSLQRYIDEFADGIFRHEAVARIAVLKAGAVRVDLDALRQVRSGDDETFHAPPPQRLVAISPHDDLKRIRGIGVLLEKKLNSMGITAYEQVANWTRTDLDRINTALDFKGRIERENWVEQARILAVGGATEFSRRFDHGEVESGSYKS